MELKHVLKALNEALERAELNLKWQTERAEKDKNLADDLKGQIERLSADYKKLENKYTELEKRYRELKQGTEDY